MAIESVGGGSCRHLVDLAGALGRRGHAVHILYSPLRADPRYVKEIRALPATATAIDMHRSIGLHDLRSIREVGAAIRNHGPFDIVHGHSSKAGALIRLASVGKSKRVYTSHAFRGMDLHASLPTRTLFNSVEMMLGAARTDAVIAVSSEELNFARRWHIADGRCHLIHNGVMHGSDVAPKVARAALKLSRGHIVIGFVGRLSHQKAPERFVEAMVRAMLRDSRIRAVIMDDGENADTIKDDIAASGLGDRFIRLSGKAAQDYLPAFDAIMMTSRYEGLSYVLLESLACGVPIITTAVAGARDVIGASGCGFITRNDEGVIDGLENAVMQLATDPALRASMVEAAKRRSAELNGSRMIDDTERLYRSLLRSP